MKNRNKIYLYAIIILFIIINLSFYSCNKEENTIVSPPEPPPDTVSRYIWTAIRLLTPMFNVYAADTNLLYIVGNGQLLTFDGTNVSLVNLNDPNFLVMDVYGFGKNDIFVTGDGYNKNSKVPMVKKISNGNVESFILDNEDTGIYDLLVTGPNQAWFSSHTKNKVYYFNSGTITEHRISDNDSISRGIFYKNVYDEIFIFPLKLDSNFTGFVYTYKFTGGKFHFLKKECYNSSNENCLTDLIYRCGKDVLMLTDFPIIKYFNGSEWVIHSYMQAPETTVPYKIGGVSRDSLVAFCVPRRDIYTYNGVKWRRENGSPYLEPSTGLHRNIETKFGNVYFTFWDYDLGIFGYVIIGKPNETFSNLK